MGEGSAMVEPRDHEGQNLDLIAEALRAIAVDAQGVVTMARGLQTQAGALSRTVLDAAALVELAKRRHDG
jgi:hypothetical protein